MDLSESVPEFTYLLNLNTKSYNRDILKLSNWFHNNGMYADADPEKFQAIEVREKKRLTSLVLKA